MEALPGGRPAEPAKPGSARAKMFDSLKKVSEKGDAREAQRAAPVKAEPSKVDPPKAASKPAEAAKPATSEPAKPADEKVVGGAEDPKKGKVNPWKLVDEYKAKVAKLEADHVEVSKRAIPEDQWKKANETLAQRESRLKELEEEIRYVNYSKSEEFKTKYQQPYEKQWQRTMAELGELTVETADGGTRPLAANDILDLVNAPLGKAHELAVERFGDLAPEVMAHRKEIRKLFDEQSSALDEARKSGADREKSITEQSKRREEELGSYIMQTWSKANEEAMADPKNKEYFTPIDGDQEGNLLLAKGYELSDRAFSENPKNAKTKEERDAIVRRHAAVRHRAAAFGRLKQQNRNNKARITALEKQLAEYKGSEPPAGGSLPAKSNDAKPTGMSRIREGLQKIAK